MTPELLSEELVIPDINRLITEDNIPVDNFQSEKQQRLLVEPLYSSQAIASPFVAAANVGLFYGLKIDPIVPDTFLSLGVQMPTDWSQKQNRSYFVWEFGKVPDICIEIVSNREGKELDSKKQIYAQIGVPYYAVFDPLQQLQKPTEMDGQLLKVWALNVKRYVELPHPFWLDEIGIGLTLWDGEFEGQTETWLRWCDQTGKVIPTGSEDRDSERQRANEAELKAQRLAERLRAMGIDPDDI